MEGSYVIGVIGAESVTF